MKVLVNNDYKAIRVGDFVTASEEAGEFILDTENCDLKVATLLEVASANKITVSKTAKKEEVLVAIEEGIAALELPAMDKESDSDIVRGIVKQGMEDGLDDDDIIVQIIQAGIKYKVASRMFQNAVTDLGFRISSKERKTGGRKILVDADFHPASYDDVVEMASSIVAALDDTNTVQAIKIIRVYCKEFEIEFPKVEKAARGSFRTQAFAYMVSNPLATREQTEAWARSTGRIKNDAALERIWKTFEHAKNVAAATVALQSAE